MRQIDMKLFVLAEQISAGSEKGLVRLLTAQETAPLARTLI